MTTTTITVTWHSTSYTSTNVKRLVPANPGVYLIGEKQSDGGWTVIYVGKTETLEARLLDHLQPTEPNGCLRSRVGGGRAHVWWAQVDKARIAGVEKFLYDHYTPTCNQADPGGRPTSVNLP